ncbi:MAG: CPBP family intramembrane metalloprotease [Anaerolineales bacterium]|nr:MAG: CPBP family intramembrane metalloprotease [Anaerolineales bacterium]
MNHSIRNLIIFIMVVILCGWIGVWLNTQIPSPSPQESLGLLIFILAPLLTVFLLRGFGGDGWADFGLRLNLKGNWGWYALAVLIYPVTIILTFSLSLLSGASIPERSLSDLLPIFLFGIAASLVKNIGEEFAWRGYLTPRFKAIGLSDFNNHMLTGLIWGVWHIPYWIFLLGSDIIGSYTSIGMTGFIVLGLVGIFPTALVLGELRLKTDSLWPSFIAHNITNALSAPLILEGFIKFKPGMEFIFSPNTDGVIMIALFWAIGLWMLRRN